MAIKSTKLNAKEKIYIETNYHEQTPKELAVAIGKPIWVVREYIEEISPNVKKSFRRSELPDGARDDAKVDPIDDVVICPELREKHEWAQLKRELTASELRMFEQSYKNYIDQFQGDVLATEESQIRQAVKLEIFMMRNDQNKLQIQMDLDEVAVQISDEENIPIHNRNDSKLMNLKSQRQSLISSIPSLTKEWNECADKHSKIMTTLRGTREQRVKQAADAKTNILGLLKEFQTERFRKENALGMEVNKFALNEEMNRLSQPHTYMDGEVDRPILNWETDLDDDISLTNKNESDNNHASTEESSEGTSL